MHDANTKQRQQFIRDLTRLKFENRLIAFGCGLILGGLCVSFFI